MSRERKNWEVIFQFSLAKMNSAQNCMKWRELWSENVELIHSYEQDMIYLEIS